MNASLLSNRTIGDRSSEYVAILEKIERQAGSALDKGRIEQQIALKYCRDVAQDILKDAP